MHMSDEEIIRRYREAKHKKQQIEILAELNAVPKEYIVDTLRKNNVPMPGNPNFVKPKAVIKNSVKETAKVTTEKVSEEVLSGTTQEEPKPTKQEIPPEVRAQLEQDIIDLGKQITTLVDRRVAITKFLLENNY